MEDIAGFHISLSACAQDAEVKAVFAGWLWLWEVMCEGAVSAFLSLDIVNALLNIFCEEQQAIHIVTELTRER